MLLEVGWGGGTRSVDDVGVEAWEMGREVETRSCDEHQQQMNRVDMEQNCFALLNRGLMIASVISLRLLKLLYFSRNVSA